MINSAHFQLGHIILYRPRHSLEHNVRIRTNTKWTACFSVWSMESFVRFYHDDTKLNAYIYKHFWHWSRHMYGTSWMLFFFKFYFLRHTEMSSRLVVHTLSSFRFSADVFDIWICASVTLCKMLILISMFLRLQNVYRALSKPLRHCNPKQFFFV